MIPHDQLVALAGDMTKYFDFSLNWRDLLNQTQTFGFPLFLQTIAWIDPTCRILPWVTWGLWIAALTVMCRCLKSAGFRNYLIMGILIPVSLSVTMRPWAWGNNPFWYANPERLTAILSVVIFGLTIRAMKLDKGYWALGFSVLAVCLVRPAMLFMPIVLFLMVPRLRLVQCVGVPIILFVTLRCFVCNDCAFVSYGAYNATRMCAMLVQPKDLDRAPEHLKPIIHVILDYGAKVGDGGIEYDRASERDFYHRWYNGDYYHRAIDPYLADHFKTDTERNALLRDLWSHVTRWHWRERLSIYQRAFRVALGKFPDPLLTVGLAVIFWVLMIKRMLIWELDIEPFVLMVKWTGLWLAISIAFLLCVQWPDDRYMQVCWFWVPGMLGAGIALVA